ncbi:sensor domain-containing protein [Kitasatospora sp. NPDC051914]|uniref:sensor domain-containing protein n=1 Tax=Kitasatospora sp. NPDC051914 TaxID=3154945 RepID=UPI0034338233
MTDDHRNTPPAETPPTRQQTPEAVPSQQPAPPLAPPRGPGTRGLARALRHWRLFLAAVVPCLVLAVVGWWIWPQQPTGLPPHIAAGTVQADLLSPDGAGRLAGTTLVAGPRSNRPHAPLAVSPPDCAVAVGPTTQSVYGQAWTAFLSATYRDAEGTGAHTVNQVIGVFPDGEKAGAAFRTLTDGLAKCPSSTRTDQAGRTTKWAYTAQPPTPVAVAWTAAQDGSAKWACHHQARVKGTSLLQVAVCQAGDGQPTAAKLADALTGKVSG